VCRRRSSGSFVNNEPGKKAPTKKSRSQSAVLILLPDKERLNYPLTQEVIRGINSRDSSYNLRTEILFWEKSTLVRLRKNSLKKEFIGIIIDKEGLPDKEVIKLIDEHKWKIAFFNSYVETHREIPSVFIDNGKGAFLAIKYLIKKGHRKIAVIFRSKTLSNPPAYRTDYSKFGGYRTALGQHEIRIDGKYQKDKVFDDKAKIRKATMELLDAGSPPTAIFCADDLIAFEVLKTLNEKRVRVPEDISLIGFNNFVHSQISQPKLTTIEAPMFEMGQRAVDLLFANSKNKQLVLGTKLIERDSVRAPHHQGRG
jgi:DNA-binding LacI/PurR family transcriptional regulator